MFFSIKLSALVASEMKIYDLDDGILCNPKMSNFHFVTASSRGSISVSVEKSYVLAISQFKS